MKKIHLTAALLLLSLAGCGFLGGSAAFKTYKLFADALSRGNCGEMQGLVEKGGSAQALVDTLCTPSSITAYGKTYNTGTGAGMIAELNSTPASAMRRFVYKLESETKAPGGAEISLVVKRSVVGRNSAMNPLPPPIMHNVTLRKSGGAWKLTEFSQK